MELRRSTASFGWDFLDDFTLEGGVRYNWERKKFDFSCRAAPSSGPAHAASRGGARPGTAPTGTIRLTYRFAEDVSAYWKYTRGWKGGHYNATALLGVDRTSTPPSPRRSTPSRPACAGAGSTAAWASACRSSTTTTRTTRSSSSRTIPARPRVRDPQRERCRGLRRRARPAGRAARGLGAPRLRRPRPDRALRLAREPVPRLRGQVYVRIESARRGRSSGPRSDSTTGNQLLNSPRFKVSLTAE